MKSRDHVCSAVFAAVLIIGCSLSAMWWCTKRRTGQKRQLEEAVQTWEDEGGAFVAERDENDEPSPTLVR